MRKNLLTALVAVAVLCLVSSADAAVFGRRSVSKQVIINKNVGAPVRAQFVAPPAVLQLNAVPSCNVQQLQFRAAPAVIQFRAH